MGVVYERAWLQEQVGEEQRIRRDVLAHLDQTDLNLLKECPHCGACFDSAARVCSADGTELTVTLPVERTIDRKYRLDRRIGRGGMGAVYEGTDLRLNRKIAVKVMIGSLFGNRSALRRFEREAKAAALLNHINIVAIHDFGMIGQDGAYLVMERVFGSTWRAELQRRGSLPPPRAAEWFAQLLAGLRAAHEAGVVHRDLKPENVLVVPLEGDSERIKILDFGLAKLRLFESGDTQSLTMAGGILGTVGYMSPEQLSGAESDERSDIFSVGVMAFEAITGRRPFEGRNYAEILTSMMRGRIQLAGDSPQIAALNDVLARCMANDPAARYRSVVELQSFLLDALKGCPAVVAAAGLGGDAVTRSLGQ
jgi:serine/threonine protein kinase